MHEATNATAIQLHPINGKRKFQKDLEHAINETQQLIPFTNA